MKKSGIYKTHCTSCNVVYIGQTQRNMEIKFSKHANHLILGHRNQTATLLKHGNNYN